MVEEERYSTNLLQAYNSLGCSMSLIKHLLHPNVNFFPTALVTNILKDFIKTLCLGETLLWQLNYCLQTIPTKNF